MTTPMYWFVIVAAIVVAALVVARIRANRARDGVDSFRRQIDALSPEARRPVIDQVHNAANRIDPRPIDDDNAESDDVSDEAASDDDDDAESDDEDGPRGA